MTDAELKVGLAFHGISCLAAFAVLLYMRRKAEEALRVCNDFLLGDVKTCPLVHTGVRC